MANEMITYWPFPMLMALPFILRPIFSVSSRDHHVLEDTNAIVKWLRTRNVAFWLRLALPLYMLHQFEEHGYDLRGQRYAFRGDACKLMVSNNLTFKALNLAMLTTAQGHPDLNTCPLTPSQILSVNCVNVWAAGLGAQYLPVASAGVNSWALILVNGTIHVVGSVRTGLTYNAGLASGLLLFLPLSYFALETMVSERRIRRAQVGKAVGVAVFSHAWIIGVTAAVARGWVGEGVACFLQAIGVVPSLFVGWPRDRAS